MSAYNILKVHIECPSCHTNYLSHIQFKFGDTWQLEYKIGDKIRWGGNDNGKPGLPKVKVYGILDGVCPNCGLACESEYDIIIEQDVIKGLTPMADIKDYTANYDYNYAIIP